MRNIFFSILFFLPFSAISADYIPPSLYLEELTWPEVKTSIEGGITTIIIPTGGTEQNGAHMALGKHNAIVKYASHEIASKLGNALVAPVMAYVPEGSITPPEGHMRYAGTLSLRESTFEAVLEDAARSLKQHGFTHIVLLGDSGGNQEAQQKIAQRLSAEWKNEKVSVVHLAAYYKDNGQGTYLRKKGFKEKDIGTHAAMEDTSELMAIAPAMVREDIRAETTTGANAGVGGTGDASKASTKLGETLIKLKIDAAAKALE